MDLNSYYRNNLKKLYSRLNCLSNINSFLGDVEEVNDEYFLGKYLSGPKSLIKIFIDSFLDFKGDMENLNERVKDDIYSLLYFEQQHVTRKRWGE